MAGRWAAIGFVFGLWLAQPGFAQTAEQRPSILTLDQDALFARSLYGQALTRAIETEAEALQAENRDIDTRLEAEERALTERRAAVSGAEFRPLAEAFDQKVEALRAAQDAKARALAQKRDEGKNRFIQTVGPILGDYMVQQGAFAIVNRAAVVVSLGAIDITDEVIAELDARLGNGSGLPAEAAPSP